MLSRRVLTSIKNKSFFKFFILIITLFIIFFCITSKYNTSRFVIKKEFTKNTNTTIIIITPTHKRKERYADLVR